MKMKVKILRAVVSFTLIIGATLSLSAQERVESREFELGKNTEILINMFREVEMFYVDQIDSNKLLEGATRGMVSELDPYTEYISEKDMEGFELLTTGKYGGIGSLIRQKGDWVYIAQPYKGFPADKAGLVVGDKILEIDGVDAKGIGSAKVSSSMKGEPGTSFKLKVEKFFTGESVELEIKRERIEISGVPYYGFVADSIGYIEHNDFTQDCSNDMRRAVMELKKQGMKGLVLDYRSNGGGILQEAVKILSMFLPKGTEVVSMRGRTEESKVVYRTESEPIDLETPIVVLVNRNSASAAEIVAGALQDLDRGVVVGQRTFGKGLVQSTRPAGYNSYVKITTAKYYMPSGRCVQAIDYEHRAEDGRVGYVPDSLIREFRTKAGRRVYDGTGIMPDVKQEPEYMSRFTIITYSKGYIDDFADEYMRKNRERAAVDLKTFRLAKEDYEEFKKFMADKDVEYKSETAEMLVALRTKAERELYIDQIDELIKEIEKQLHDDKESCLELYREDLARLIENNIVMRQHYTEGVTEFGLRFDKEVKKAVELLIDQPEYQRIVTSQDVEKE